MSVIGCLIGGNLSASRTESNKMTFQILVLRYGQAIAVFTRNLLLRHRCQRSNDCFIFLFYSFKVGLIKYNSFRHFDHLQNKSASMTGSYSDNGLCSSILSLSSL